MGLLKFAFALINPVSRQQAHSTMKVLRSEKGSRLASSRSFAIANENMHHFSIANEEIHAMSSTLHDILANQTDSEKAVKRAMRRFALCALMLPPNRPHRPPIHQVVVSINEGIVDHF